MPSCFSLTRKSDLAAGPVPLLTIDEEICEMMGVMVHPKKWCNDWYGAIGLDLACGDTFEEIKITITNWDYGPKELLLKIVEWLDTNFVANAWSERK